MLKLILASRILAGMSCAESAGAHYWDGDGEDPWLSVKYDSSTDPANVLFVEVDTGLGRSDLLGRTVVIHDKTGARIACGVIEDGMSCGSSFREQPAAHPIPSPCKLTLLQCRCSHAKQTSAGVHDDRLRGVPELWG